MHLGIQGSRRRNVRSIAEEISILLFQRCPENNTKPSMLSWISASSPDRSCYRPSPSSLQFKAIRKELPRVFFPAIKMRGSCPPFWLISDSFCALSFAYCEYNRISGKYLNDTGIKKKQPYHYQADQK